MNNRDDEHSMFEFESVSDRFTLDRRDFLKLMGGGICIFVSSQTPLTLQERRRGGYPDDFNAYLRIGEDGRVSCFTGKIEMGQGIITSLAQMLAEELDVSMDVVDMVMGDTALCPYDAGTFGSRSTKYFGPPLRQAAAEARAVLIQLAAERLKAEPDQLDTRNGTVFLKVKSETALTYAELAKGQRIERHLEPKPPIKPHSGHKISGHPHNRTDGLAKVTGQAKFAGDLRPSGLLHARILRPPAHGAKLKSLDTSAAEAIAGTKIIRDGDLVAVLHQDRDAAEKGLSLIEAAFDPSDNDLDDSTIFDHLKKSGSEGETVTEAGNLDAGKVLAKQSFHENYFNHYVAHAPSETHTATVQIEGDSATVWASTQSPFRVQRDAAEALAFPLEKVRVITPFVGCGFGGKNQGYQVGEAARLAKLSGQPVQVAWSRKEEFFYDTFRPAAVIEILSGLDDSGKITYWDYHNYFAGSRSSEPVYDIPNLRVLSIGGWGGGGSPHPFGVGAWRGPGSNTNVFAMESHIDRMAAASGLDPFSFRQKNLKDDRMKKVMDAAAEIFGRSFRKAPSGSGFGLAITNYLNSYVVTMAEVEVEKKTGRIKVNRIVCAQDMGEIINPEGARMQIEGCLTMGLGYCLTEQIRFSKGRILDENFDTYEIPRFSWLPVIETVLIDNPDIPPQGCGEPAITTMGAVVANAVFDAAGVRLQTLPMTPARMLEALART